MISPDVTGTVGRTPLVELGRLAAGVPGRVVAKLEMRNPCGSVKDRLGLALVEDAERRGLLKPGMSSGAAAYAALLLAARPEAEGKTIVVLLADTGERYVTTALMTEPLS